MHNFLGQSFAAGQHKCRGHIARKVKRIYFVQRCVGGRLEVQDLDDCRLESIYTCGLASQHGRNDKGSSLGLGFA